MAWSPNLSKIPVKQTGGDFEAEPLTTELTKVYFPRFILLVDGILVRVEKVRHHWRAAECEQSLTSQLLDHVH